MAAATREPAHLTTAELAARWRTSANAILIRRSRGKAPKPIRGGRGLLWPLAEVEKWERARAA